MLQGYKGDLKMSTEKNNINEVKKVIQSVRASWWEDGLIEVMSGCVFVFMAAFFCLIEFLPDTNLKKGLEIGFYAVLIIFAISSAWVKRHFKKKYIWPKTGYARPQMSKKSRGVFLFVFVLILLNILLIVLWQIYQSSASEVSLPGFFAILNYYRQGFFIGSFVFLAYFAVYLSMEKKRFLVAGILGLCSGIIASSILRVFDLNRDRIMAAIILGVIGVYSLSTGIPRFLRFRKANKEA
jgi:hypothetical protein